MEPSSPSSTPSYRRCAIIMVRLTLKRSLREESCCNLLVVNGGAAFRRRSFFSTLRTSQSAVSSAVRILVAASSFGTSIFSSPLPRKRASNAGGLGPARLASMVQYSFFSFLISLRRQVLRRGAQRWPRLRGPGQARDKSYPCQAPVSSAWQQPSLCRG